MTEDEIEQLALFRFSLIAPAVHGLHSYKNKTELFKAAAENPVLNPVTGKMTKYSWKTLSYWLCQYRKDGLDGLRPRSRCDLGEFRKLDDSVMERIIEILVQNPRMPNTSIREKLKKEGLITDALSQ